jgi:hypothetical protein
VTFQWSSGTGVTNYFLYVGRSIGTNDIYGQSEGLNLSATVNGLPTDGSTLYVRLWWATAAAGWQFTDYIYAAYTLPTDTTPPTVSISSPTSGQTFTNSPITVSGTANDPGSPSTGVSLVQVQVNGTGGTWQTASGTNMWSASASLSPGANTIYVRSRDGAGNYSTIASVSVTYTPDTQGPALVINSPVSGATVTSPSLLVSGTASDSGRGNNGVSSVTVNGVRAANDTASGTGTANWSATITLLSAGANIITVVATDTVGNRTIVQINVTYNPPQPIFGGPSVVGGKLQTTLSGLSVGETVVIYSSTDLKNWTPIKTNAVNGSTLSFTNSINQAMKGQYFRAVVQ